MGGTVMADEEKIARVIKHKARRMGYFVKMTGSLLCILPLFRLRTTTEGVLSVLCIVAAFICMMVAFIFKTLHQGMLYCPLCGAAFGYGSWMTGSMPYVCPHCGEKLNY